MTAERRTSHAVETWPELDSVALLEHLRGKRWFGEKGRALGGATVVDVVPIQWTGRTRVFGAARVRVVGEGEDATYQLFLEQGAGITDALEDAEFRRGLADAFASGAEFAAGDTRWILASEGERPLVVPAATRVTLASAEQSNSSVIIDGEAILKLFRRLARGIHPDVEVTRYLTRERGFVHVPVLLGTIRFEDAAGEMIAGMLQELVPDAEDGWEYAVRSARSSLTRTDKGGGDPIAPTRGGRDGQEAPPFAADARALGVVTRAMHEALAAGAPGSAFERARARRADVGEWARAASLRVDESLDALHRALRTPNLARDAAAEARRLVERRPEFREWIDTLARDVADDAGFRSRTHGDYHLGQVLRSASKQFFVIDFEGEPSRPLDERRAHRSPLRDVAGMLRSFDYAAAVALGSERGGRRAENDAAASTLRSPFSADRWSRAVRLAFLDGYLDAPDAASDLLPASRANVDRVIALFEVEKMFYELRYELDHRPDWLWVPMQAITQLLP